MKVFLCSYNNFLLAIPIDFVSSISIFTGNIESTIEYNNTNRNTYISLPLLFNNSLLNAKHCIILKKECDNNDDNSILENRFILLSTAVECEMEIPEDEIFPIPKTLSLYQFSLFFNGLIFKAYQNKEDMILLLNPGQLVQNIQKWSKL